MDATSTVPVSTYRVQVRPDFDLDTAAELAPYLASLGVTHFYSAPLLAATPGSAHGYDVVDPTRVNPELGGADALDRLVAALRSVGLGLVVDIVPNHLGVARPETNPAWWSVLRDGPDSPYAPWFDIDWSRGPLLIPVLGDDSLDDVFVDRDAPADPNCATSSTAIRSRRAPTTGRRPRCTCGSTTGWSTGAAPTPS